MFNASVLNIYPFIHYKFNKMAFWPLNIAPTFLYKK